MAAVRPIDLSARRGALLTGIPLLVGGLAPINMEPLTFLWDVAAQTHSVRPLLIPAAGLMITAVGLLPGLPRLVRGLLILLFVTVPGYFSFEMLTGMGGERAGAFLHSVRGQLLVASIGVAAVTEMMVSWKKTSKVLAGLAMVGWLSFVVLMSLPGADGKLLVLVMFDGLTNLSRLPGILPKIMAGWVSGLPLLLLVFGVLGGVFALIRLVRSSEGMLRSFYRSGWAGILMAGSISLFLTGYLVLGAIALEVYEAILPAVGAGLMLFGLCVGVTAGLAHTLLGLMSPPGPIVVEDFVPGMVGQPKAAGEPQPYAHPAFSRDPTPDQMFARQPYGQPLPQAFDQPPAQPFGQAPAQPFAQPPAQPFAQPPAQPFAQPPAQPFGQPAAQPDNQQAKKTTPLPPQPKEAKPEPQPDYGGRGQVNAAQRQEADWQRPQEQPRSAQASSRQEQQRAAAAPAGMGSQPAGVRLEPYPGYPGYYVCPNPQCRGGVALNSPTCPHCGHRISWE